MAMAPELRGHPLPGTEPRHPRAPQDPACAAGGDRRRCRPRDSAIDPEGAHHVSPEQVVRRSSHRGWGTVRSGARRSIAAIGTRSGTHLGGGPQFGHGRRVWGAVLSAHQQGRATARGCVGRERGTTARCSASRSIIVGVPAPDPGRQRSRPEWYHLARGVAPPAVGAAPGATHDRRRQQCPSCGSAQARPTDRGPVHPTATQLVPACGPRGGLLTAHSRASTTRRLERGDDTDGRPGRGQNPRDGCKMVPDEMIRGVFPPRQSSQSIDPPASAGRPRLSGSRCLMLFGAQGVPRNPSRTGGRVPGAPRPRYGRGRRGCWTGATGVRPRLTAVDPSFDHGGRSWRGRKTVYRPRDGGRWEGVRTPESPLRAIMDGPRSGYGIRPSTCSRAGAVNPRAADLNERPGRATAALAGTTALTAVRPDGACLGRVSTCCARPVRVRNVEVPAPRSKRKQLGGALAVPDAARRSVPHPMHRWAVGRVPGVRAAPCRSREENRPLPVLVTPGHHQPRTAGWLVTRTATTATKLGPRWNEARGVRCLRGTSCLRRSDLPLRWPVGGRRRCSRPEGARAAGVTSSLHERPPFRSRPLGFPARGDHRALPDRLFLCRLAFLGRAAPKPIPGSRPRACGISGPGGTWRIWAPSRVVPLEGRHSVARSVARPQSGRAPDSVCPRFWRPLPVTGADSRHGPYCARRASPTSGRARDRYPAIKRHLGDTRTGPLNAAPF